MGEVAFVFGLTLGEAVSRGVTLGEDEAKRVGSWVKLRRGTESREITRAIVAALRHGARVGINRDRNLVLQAALEDAEQRGEIDTPRLRDLLDEARKPIRLPPP